LTKLNPFNKEFCSHQNWRNYSRFWVKSWSVFCFFILSLKGFFFKFSIQRLSVLRGQISPGVTLLNGL